MKTSNSRVICGKGGTGKGEDGWTGGGGGGGALRELHRTNAVMGATWHGLHFSA